MTEHAVRGSPGAWGVEADAEWQPTTQGVVVRLAFAATDWKGEFLGPCAPLPVRGKSDATVVLNISRSFGSECGDDDFSDVILDLVLSLRSGGRPVLTMLARDALEDLQAEQEHEDRFREPADRRCAWSVLPARGFPATEHHVTGSVARRFAFTIELTLTKSAA